MPKTCSKCKTEKPLTAFYERPDRPGSLRSRCKDCSRRPSKEKKPDPDVKRCSKCYREKPHADFYPRSGKPDALRSQCKLCCRGGGVYPTGAATLWQTSSTPVLAHLRDSEGLKMPVEITPNGEVYLDGESQGFPETVLRSGYTLVVQYEEGLIVARSDLHVTVRSKGCHADSYKWDYDGSLRRLFSYGKSRPAIWRAPSSSATIDAMRTVVVLPELSDTLATARTPRSAKG